jgi:Ti type entry exclusion protein TrbK
MMGTWFQSEQTDKDLAQARREKFFNTTPPSVRAARAWSPAGEPRGRHGAERRRTGRRRPDDRMVRRRARFGARPASTPSATENRRQKAHDFLGGDPDRDVRGGQEMKPRW